MIAFLYKRQFQTIWLAVFLLLTGLISAQNTTKKKYNPELDSLWSRSTYINSISNDGNWIVLTERFDQKENLVWLKHTTDSTFFKFPDSNWIRLAENSKWFGTITKDNQLNIVSLESLETKTYNNIMSYGFSNSGDYLAAFQKDSDSDEKLLIVDLKENKIVNLDRIKNYKWHPDKNRLLLTSQSDNLNKITVFDVDQKYGNVLLETASGNFNHVDWSSSGSHLVAMEQVEQENTIHFIPQNESKLSLTNNTLQSMFPGYKISNRKPWIAEDGSKLLFYREQFKDIQGNESETMEIWSTEDPLIYPKMRDFENNEQKYLLTAWYPHTNRLIEIETTENPTAAADVNHRYALVYNPMKYEPLYKEFSNADIYVKDMETGLERLVVKNQYLGPGLVKISPTGKYINYFKEKHWWVYNIEKGFTKNLTLEIGLPFEDFERNYTGDPPPFGITAWSNNDEFFIAHDHYDIWMITPDGNQHNRITNGRNEKIKHRVSKEHLSNNVTTQPINRDFASTAYDVEKGLIIELNKSDTHQTGYAIWKQDHTYKRIVFDTKKIDAGRVTKDFKNLFYRKQKFNESPGIYRVDVNGVNNKLIYQSNKELHDFNLGEGKLLEYKVNDQNLTTSLIYPANYNPQKTYPMIVMIYEKLSGFINIFNPPSLYDYTGFNTLKYTTNDYFVLYPDISYTINEPGKSALISVNAAIDKALISAAIDKNKIGLIGHSFGGYQTAFIATQTDRFAAIVSGAAITNITSHYHSIGWNWNQPEIWRYEAQQWRMNKSYYDDPKSYLTNSPLHQAENIKTPLLLWTGKNDYQVYWTQSIEMYLSLKRQNKPAKLLLFEEEHHVLMNKSNQQKLSIEILNWFDEYCK